MSIAATTESFMPSPYEGFTTFSVVQKRLWKPLRRRGGHTVDACRCRSDKVGIH